MTIFLFNGTYYSGKYLQKFPNVHRFIIESRNINYDNYDNYCN